jgi:hypothetical protein
MIVVVVGFRMVVDVGRNREGLGCCCERGGFGF